MHAEHRDLILLIDRRLILTNQLVSLQDNNRLRSIEKKAIFINRYISPNYKITFSPYSSSKHLICKSSPLLVGNSGSIFMFQSVVERNHIQKTEEIFLHNA